MLFIQSLFCFSGADNRHRFIIIHLSCYFLFTIFSSIFVSSNLLSFLILCFFTSLSAFSTKRRSNDSNINKNWLFVSTLSFLITGLIIIFTDHNVSYWLLLFPIMVSGLLMTYQSLGNRKYILGYFGDIDLSAYINKETFQNKMRIEPTFNQGESVSSAASTMNSATNISSQNENNAGNTVSQSHTDIGEAIRFKLLSHKKTVLTVITLILFIIMAVILTSIFSNSADSTKPIPDNETTQKIQQQQHARLHKITLPDDFTLFVSEFDGITIKWQGDVIDDTFLWRQLTAQGDESCKNIVFNNDETIRTLSVLKENGSDYLASFSPLDTKKIIKNIAIRSTFSLCGYKFSLKGSQSTLGKHPYYSELVVK